MDKVLALLRPPMVGGRPSLGLLLARVVIGLTMAAHGLGKIKNPLHWMDGAPNPAPAFLQLLAAVSEFGGGLAIAAGLLTPVAALGIVCTMLYAIQVHRGRGDKYINPGGGSYELAGLHLIFAVLFLIVGPGKLSVDAKLFGEKKS